MKLLDLFDKTFSDTNPQVYYKTVMCMFDSSLGRIHKFEPTVQHKDEFMFHDSHFYDFVILICIRDVLLKRKTIIVSRVSLKYLYVRLCEYLVDIDKKYEFSLILDVDKNQIKDSNGDVIIKYYRNAEDLRGRSFSTNSSMIICPENNHEVEESILIANLYNMKYFCFNTYKLRLSNQLLRFRTNLHTILD